MSTVTTESPVPSAPGLPPTQQLPLHDNADTDASSNPHNLTQDDILNYKGQDHDEAFERMVLMGAATGVGAIVFASSWFAGLHLSKQYWYNRGEEIQKPGFFRSIARKFYQPKINSVADSIENSVTFRPSVGSSTTTSSTATKASATTSGAVGSTTVQKQPTPTASYAKFQRKVDAAGENAVVADPGWEKAAAYAKEHRQKHGSKRYHNYRSIPPEIKAQASKTARRAFFFGSIFITAITGSVVYGICNLMGVTSYNQFVNHMSTEGASYRPDGLIETTKKMNGGVRNFLYKTPLRHLMNRVSDELQKQDTLSSEDWEIWHQAGKLGTYFVTYEFDLFNMFLRRPSRAKNADFPVLEWRKPTQALPQADLDREKLSMLRQLAGLSPVVDKQDGDLVPTTIDIPVVGSQDVPVNANVVFGTVPGASSSSSATTLSPHSSTRSLEQAVQSV